MINLYPWREKRRRRHQQLALVIVLLCSLISIGGVLHRTHRQSLEIALMRQELRQLNGRVPPKSATFSKVVYGRLKGINALVWQRDRFLQKIIRLLSSVPSAVTVRQLECRHQECALDVSSIAAKTIIHNFGNYKLTDIKQGACPACYRARISIAL
ncbi:MAG: hypothetical protein COB66_08610 [Coxiella sp. (in: Bacteria)]|nr:MAG: hypothetical protein COB66_08610 [Coxiella sp. (in: g-proteobacteria)]